MDLILSKTFKGMLVLIILDFIIIWLCVKHMEIDGSSGMGIFIVVPPVFLLNFIIGVILFFLKRDYCYMFILNSFIGSVIMYHLFDWRMGDRMNEMYDSWNFAKNDTVYTINKFNESNSFSISYQTDHGSSTEFITGLTKSKGDTLFLAADSIHIYIYKNGLYNFSNKMLPIHLNKIQ